MKVSGMASNQAEFSHKCTDKGEAHMSHVACDLVFGADAWHEREVVRKQYEMGLAHLLHREALDKVHCWARQRSAFACASQYPAQKLMEAMDMPFLDSVYGGLNATRYCSMSSAADDKLPQGLNI